MKIHPLFLLAVLVLPSALANIGIYAKGFSPDCYSYVSSSQELTPQSPQNLSYFLRDRGFQAEVINTTDHLSDYDAVFVLGCTKMDSQDVEHFLEYYQRGGGLVVDDRDNNPLAQALGVRQKPYMLSAPGGESITTSYVSITNGVLIKGIVQDDRGPMVYGNERMYYVGRPLKLPSDFNPGFASSSGEDVMGWKKERGRLVVIGCLYCADPLLLENLADWSQDGRIDFPRFTIRRDIIPSEVEVGDSFVDEITISISGDVDKVSGEYLYGFRKPYCELTPDRFISPSQQPNGTGFLITLKAQYTPDKPMDCYMPPAMVHLRWNGYTRDAIVDKKPITVIATSFAVPGIQLDYTLMALGAILFLALLAGVIYYKKTERKRRILREWYRHKNILKKLKLKYMRRDISEEEYKDLSKEHVEAILRLEEIMEDMGIKPPSSGEGRGGSGQEGGRVYRSKGS